MTIQHISILLVLVGLGIYFLGLLSYLTSVKGKQVSPLWLWNNRRYKVIQAAVTALIGGYLAYLYYDPSSIEDSKRMAEYQAVTVLIGFLNTFILDFASNFAIKRAGVTSANPVRPYEDDGKTIMQDKE